MREPRGKVALGVALVFTLAALFSPAAADAAFPGQNGLVAFERTVSGDPPQKSDIWVTPPWSAAETNLTNTPAAEDIDPAFSPDGNRIAFASDRDGDFDIYVMNAAGSDLQQVTNTPAIDTHPTWSPNGAQIAFQHGDPNAHTDIWVADAFGGGVFYLAPGAQPAWSPDGTRIAFLSNPIGTSTARFLNVMDSTGDNPVQIYDSAATEPDWAPDGSEIAFSAYNNDFTYYWDESEIYAIKPDGTGLRNVSHNADGGEVDGDLQPAWSPDGTKIAEYRSYSFYRYYNHWISVSDAGGSGEEHSIVDSGGSDGYSPEPAIERDPAWQPTDGPPPAPSPLHARPATATPLKVPLVPAYNECTAPNTLHAAPLAVSACSPASRSSSLLTTSAVGRGRGFVLLKEVRDDPATSASETDLAITSKATDIVCATAPLAGTCPSAGSDYSGKLLLSLQLRLTDRGSKNYADSGDPFPFVTATGVDLPVLVPLVCTPTPGPAGSACDANTTINALNSFNRKTLSEVVNAVISVPSIQVMDPGPDGAVDRSYGTCPEYCGTGDESTFMTEGLFTP